MVLCHERQEEDPLVYQTGHRDDRNSPKCIIGKVHIIKDGNNFCLSCLEEQHLVALLQGSVESDDSPASGGDEEELGSKLRRTTFQSQLDLKLEGVGLKDLQPDMSSDNLQWLLSQEKPLMGLTQKCCLTVEPVHGLHHLIFLLHVKKVFCFCYW